MRKVPANVILLYKQKYPNETQKVEVTTMRIQKYSPSATEGIDRRGKTR